MNIIEANVLGSMNIVNLAKEKMIKNLLFTSTREVYGQLKDVDCISENNFGSFNPLDARSCYPESKRMAENIFKSASIQYDIPFNVARIAHSYGPGMALNDGRVIADLLGNAVNGRDIELKSDGLALRSFCYVTDAVIAMFLILLKGQNNEAYNIANECEEISIFELAQTIVGLSDKQLNITRVDPEESNMYCKYPRVSLDTSSLESLGWKPRFNLKYGMSKIINNMEYNSK
jgi:nucleoside-diphosphate-sugar epimerase